MVRLRMRISEMCPAARIPFKTVSFLSFTDECCFNAGLDSILWWEDGTNEKRFIVRRLTLVA